MENKKCSKPPTSWDYHSQYLEKHVPTHQPYPHCATILVGYPSGNLLHNDWRKITSFNRLIGQSSNNMDHFSYSSSITSWYPLVNVYISIENQHFLWVSSTISMLFVCLPAGKYWDFHGRPSLGRRAGAAVRGRFTGKPGLVGPRVNRVPGETMGFSTSILVWSCKKPYPLVI